MIMKCYRDFNLKSLAVTLNGKFIVADNVPTEMIDSKVLRKLH